MYKLCDSIEPVLNNEKASEPDPVCYIHCNGVSSGCSSTDPAVSPVRNTHCKGTSSSCLVTDLAVYPVSYIHGQMPIFFYWFRCTIRFWNSLLSSNNPLLEEIVRADLLLANRRDTWTYQVLHALQDLPTSLQFLDAIRYRQTINQRQFELTLCEHIIGGWRDLDILTPHEAHHSSRIMRTYHTHFGVPLGNTSGWWDDRKRNQKPVLPLYLRLDITSNLSRALSCLRLSGHNFLVQRMRHDRNRRPYELRIWDRCDWHTVQDEEHLGLGLGLGVSA